MKRFVCEYLNTLNFLFIRVFAKFDTDVCFMREGLRNTLTTKHATENLLNGNYGFETERLPRHSIVT